MSARYSTSPTLRLPIAESRICAAAQAAFSLCCFISLVLVATRGYPWLAIALSLPLQALLPMMHRQPMVGAILHWGQGSWSVEHQGVTEPIRIEPSSRLSSGAIFVCWCCEDGRRESVWLFPDSAPREQQRRLRVRLVLEQ